MVSRSMARGLVCAAILAAFAAGGVAGAEDSALVYPYERSHEFEAVNGLDRAALEDWREAGVRPAPLCSDAVFLRRVYLDMIGTVPSWEEARDFLADTSNGRRERLIDALFQRPEFVEYWTLRWCDVLRVKAEYPINLWPNGVQAYHRWISEAVRDNMPYDRFARALLTSSGSNFRVAPVNFYRAVQGSDPATLAGAAALTFMGARFEAWPQDRRDGMTAFFSRVAFKGTAEWKECIVFPDPAPAGPLEAVFPDGKRVTLAPEADPREAFANWLIAAENPWFARAAANRQWAWLMGRGIVHEPDDLRADNPPALPRVLDFLEKELVGSGYDLRHTMQLIVTSRLYGQSCAACKGVDNAERYFACYPVRRLDAEVLVDALNAIYGGEEQYSSAIPEPFTFVPEEHRTIALADGSISSQFLEMFGRPSRDTGLWSERSNAPTEAQRLHMLNSSHVRDKIEKSQALQRLKRLAGSDGRRLVEALYMRVLSRPATDEEAESALAYFGQDGIGPWRGANDLAWALTNSKEFLYRH